MITPRRPGQTAANHVLSIVMDQHNCHAMTEELLDTWWNSLAPEQKAEIHLASLDAPEEPAARVTACGFDMFPQSDATLAAMAELKRAVANVLGPRPVGTLTAQQ